MIIRVRDIAGEIVAAVHHSAKTIVCERNYHAAHDVCIDQTNYKFGT